MTDKKTKTDAGADLSEAEIAAAKKEGALQHVRDASARAMALDTGTASDFDKAAEQQAKQVPADFQSTFIAPFLDLNVDDLHRRLTDDKAPDPIADEHARGLLALERSGRNRTDYVKMLCKVIGVKSPLEVTTAGPGYTNDTTLVTPL